MGGAEATGRGRPWVWRMLLLLGIGLGAVGFVWAADQRIDAVALPCISLALGSLAFAVLLERDCDPAGGARLARVALVQFALGVALGVWAGWARPRMDWGGVHGEAILLLFGMLPAAQLGVSLSARTGPQAFWPALAFGLGVAGSFYLRFGAERGIRFDELFGMSLGIGGIGAGVSLGIFAFRRRANHDPALPRAHEWGLAAVGLLLAVGSLLAA